VKTAKIFIDLDGPILNVFCRYYKAYRDALKMLGFTPVSKELYWSLKRAKTPDIDILRLSFAEKHAEKYIKIRNSLIEKKKFLEYDNVWPELKEVYSVLFVKIPAVLVTLRTHAKRTHWQLKHLGIHSWFQHIYTRPDYLVSQDRWELKTEIIKKSGILKNLNINDCFFVGDTETDILAGKRLGMKTLAIAFGIRDRNILLKTKPDILFEKKAEFAAFLKKEIL